MKEQTETYKIRENEKPRPLSYYAWVAFLTAAVAIAINGISAWIVSPDLFLPVTAGVAFGIGFAMILVDPIHRFLIFIGF